MIIFSDNNHVLSLAVSALPSSFILPTSSLSICEASARWLAYRHSWLMATKSLLAKKDSTPRSERERTANCQSTRLDVQTVNLATSSLPTHACFTVLLLFDCKISSAIIGGFVHVHCTASPHAFRMASLYGHHTNAHVTGCQQWHYQKVSILLSITKHLLVSILLDYKISGQSYKALYNHSS